MATKSATPITSERYRVFQTLVLVGTIGLMIVGTIGTLVVPAVTSLAALIEDSGGKAFPPFVLD